MCILYGSCKCSYELSYRVYISETICPSNFTGNVFWNGNA